MKTQRITVDIRTSSYIGDDCPAWIYTLDMKKAIDKRFNLHWHPEMELYYVAEGGYEVFTKNETASLSKGDICIVTPGIDHSLRGLSEKAKYYSIGFNLRLIALDEGHFFQKNFVEPLATDKLAFDPVVHPQDPDYSSFFEPIRQIIDTIDEPDKLTVFAGIMSVCCALMHRCSPKPQASGGSSREHDSVRSCEDYMRHNYMQKITLDQLAQMVSLHPNYLCSVFNKYVGCSPMTYLTRIRMKQARALLRETELSVRQVAERTGFNSASFFSKRFKAIMGISPKEYGEAYRKK